MDFVIKGFILGGCSTVNIPNNGVIMFKPNSKRLVIDKGMQVPCKVSSSLGGGGAVAYLPLFGLNGYVPLNRV